MSKASKKTDKDLEQSSEIHPVTRKNKPQKPQSGKKGSRSGREDTTPTKPSKSSKKPVKNDSGSVKPQKKKKKHKKRKKQSEQERLWAENTDLLVNSPQPYATGWAVIPVSEDSSFLVLHNEDNEVMAFLPYTKEVFGTLHAAMRASFHNETITSWVLLPHGGREGGATLRLLHNEIVLFEMGLSGEEAKKMRDGFTKTLPAATDLKAMFTQFPTWWRTNRANGRILTLLGTVFVLAMLAFGAVALITALFDPVAYNIGD